MAGDLRDRLMRLKELRAGDESAGPVTGNESAFAVASDDSSRGSAGVTLDAVTLPGWKESGPLVFSRRIAVQVPGPGGVGIWSHILNRRISFANLCFMDTETTGLSGGAGTTVFLVGSGYYRGGVVTVTQTLLGDFPGEPTFLGLVENQLREATTWVSYNGKNFDSRLLETRFLLNGMPAMAAEQLDLLYWARRLWRTLIGRCSLGDIEREVLGHVRSHDVEGSEIPDRYFAFLGSHDPRPLEPVIHHHLEDIVSLVRLFFRVEQILRDFTGADPSVWPLRTDREGLGRYFARRANPACERILRTVVSSPLPHETMAVRERAAAELCRHLRRERRASEVPEVWERLWSEGSLLAGVEVAKHLEHRARDFAAAAQIVELLLSDPEASPGVDALTHRLNRLRRRVGS